MKLNLHLLYLNDLLSLILTKMLLFLSCFNIALLLIDGQMLSVYICIYYLSVRLSICVSINLFACVTPTICLSALKSVLREQLSLQCQLVTQELAE